MAWIDEMLSGIPVNAVLRERLLLISEQRVALEKKIVDLQSENDVLKTENGQLKEKLRCLEGNISKNHGQRLEDVKEKILVFLSAKPHGGTIFADHVASQCGVGAQVATHHLEEVNKRNFVLVGYSTREPPHWSLGPEGRSYLVSCVFRRT